MYSVIIAEDELLVRMGLSGSVPWEELGMRIVSEASDGLTAIEQFKKWRPNIILTDIRMPGMDGLSLIREIRRIDTDCAIIVITCMEDFQTLHKAMEMGISGYLLKATMTQDDILKSLRQACDNLSSLEGHVEAPFPPDKQMFTDALMAYLVNNNLSYEQFYKQFRQSHLIHNPPVYLVTVYIHREGGYLSLLNHSIQRMLLEKLPAGSVISLYDKERLIFLIYDDIISRLDDITETFMEFQNYVLCNLGARMRIFLYRLRIGYQYLPDTLLACANLYNDHYYSSSALIMLNERLVIIDDQIQAWLMRLKEKIREFGYVHPQVRTQYLKLIEQVGESVGKSRHHFEDALYTLVIFMANALKAFPPEKLELYQQCLHNATTIQQAMNAFDQFIDVPASAKRVYHHEINQIIEFIQNNPEQNITLSDMAHKVNLSPNYLSQLFKEVTGLNFSDYLANVRLECAKMLLQNVNTPLKEVAFRSGFTDITYFCRFFKKRTGKSPGYWRKKFNEVPS